MVASAQPLDRYRMKIEKDSSFLSDKSRGSFRLLATVDERRALLQKSCKDSHVL